MSQVTLEYAERAEYTLSPERYVVQTERIRPRTSLQILLSSQSVTSRRS
jgi:hypothetical protein